MKEISISVYEVTKEELKKITKEVPVLIYNKLTATYKTAVTLDRKAIFYSKYASEYLVYFLFDKMPIK